MIAPALHVCPRSFVSTQHWKGLPNFVASMLGSLEVDFA